MAPSPRIHHGLETRQLVGLGRVELPTSRLSGVRSNHLSYRPDDTRCFIRVQRVERETKAAKSRKWLDMGISALCLMRTIIPKGIERFILRKEVIQPQVPLRLPCYDFTPVADLTVVVC